MVDDENEDDENAEDEGEEDDQEDKDEGKKDIQDDNEHEGMEDNFDHDENTRGIRARTSARTDHDNNEEQLEA